MNYRIEDASCGVYACLRFVGDDGTKHPIEKWSDSPVYRFRALPNRACESWGSDDLDELLVLYEDWRSLSRD